jgi:uncharacterized membrane protein
MLPIPPEATNGLNFLVYVTGALLVVAGVAIAIGQRVRLVSLLLGTGLLLFFIAGHLPNRLMNSPTVLGAWTNALKILTLSGGAFVVSGVFSDGHSKFAEALSKIAPYGKYFFAFMLVIFGIDHFLYADFVKTLVPTWIPGHLFWTYFAGVALIGSGLSIFINFKLKTISLLLGTMLIFWLVLLHIPRAITMDPTDGNEIISALECLAFSGIAFLLPLKGG